MDWPALVSPPAYPTNRILGLWTMDFPWSAPPARNDTSGLWEAYVRNGTEYNDYSEGVFYPFPCSEPECACCNQKTVSTTPGEGFVLLASPGASPGFVGAGPPTPSGDSKGDKSTWEKRAKSNLLRRAWIVPLLHNHRHLAVRPPPSGWRSRMHHQAARSISCASSSQWVKVVGQRRREVKGTSGARLAPQDPGY